MELSSPILPTTFLKTARLYVEDLKKTAGKRSLAAAELPVKESKESQLPGRRLRKNKNIETQTEYLTPEEREERAKVS